MSGASRRFATIASQLPSLRPLYSHAVRQAHTKSGVNVVLEQAVDKLGREGEQITTSRGFARNFLIPGGLAKQLSKPRAAISAPGDAAEAKRLRGKGAAASSAQNLQHVLNLLYNRPVEIFRKAKPSTKAKPDLQPKLRQAVTPACIIRATLEQHKVSLSPQMLAMETLLNRAGSHEVPLRLKDATGQRMTMRVQINTQQLQPLDHPNDDRFGSINAAPGSSQPPLSAVPL